MNNMQLAHLLFQILTPILFIEGIIYLTNKTLEKFNLNKNFKLLIFSIFILIISYTLYILLNLDLKTVYLSKIFVPIVAILGFFRIFNKFKKKNYNFTKIDVIFYITISLFFFAALIPSTDADSIRYHYGQFNIYEVDAIKNNFHSRISFISDAINILFFNLKIYNFTSILNFYFLYLFYVFFVKDLKKNQKLFFFLIIFGSPLLLSLFISQKPFLYIIIIFSYLVLIINEIKNDQRKVLFLIFILNSFLMISKPNFIFYGLAFLIYSLIVTKNFKKLFYFNLVPAFIVIIFCLVNFIQYNDPLKIFFNFYFNSEALQNNQYNFLYHLLNPLVREISIITFFRNILYFFVPYAYIQHFSASLGIGVLSLFFLLNLKKYDKIYLLIGLFIIFNIYSNRLFIERYHVRDWFIIYFLLAIIVKNHFTTANFKKYLFVLPFSQFLVTTASLTFFIFSFLINGYGSVAYNYNNEKFLNDRYEGKKLVVLTHIDGNLFKKYNYINTDVLNYHYDDCNLIKNINELKKEHDPLVLVVKKKFFEKILEIQKNIANKQINNPENFSQEDLDCKIQLVLKEEFRLKKVTRNPFTKVYKDYVELEFLNKN